MDLIERLDRAAADLANDLDQTYEIGLSMAASAQMFVTDPTAGEAAALIRDVFGTWTEVIHTHGHTDGSTEEEALRAHDQIEVAVKDWTSGGRIDPLAFGRRWGATLNRGHASWLNEDSESHTTGE